MMVFVMGGSEADFETFRSKILFELYHGSHVTLHWVQKDKSM